MPRLRALLLGMVLIAFTTNANAFLIEQDWRQFGDNLILLDDSTGLEWLDLSVTLGNSIAATEAEDYFDEFRWATVDEIALLFTHGLGVNNIQIEMDLPDVQAFFTFFDFIQQIGGVSYLENEDSVKHWIASGITPRSTFPGFAETTEIWIPQTLQFIPVFVTTRDPGDNCCLPPTASHPRVGSWLVRVPEPSTMMILLVGLVAIGCERLRRTARPASRKSSLRTEL